MVLLLYALTASAWDCPLCGQHFNSDSSLPHNCQPDYSKPEALNHLLSQSGFTLEPSSFAGAKAVFSEYLGYLPLFEHDLSLPWDITQWLYNWFDHLGLCEHGGSVGGSWSTSQGTACLQNLNSDRRTETAFKTRICKRLRSFKKWCLRNMRSCSCCNSHGNVETAPSADVCDFRDWYFETAGMCGCGNPEEVYKLLYDSITFFETYPQAKKPYEKFPVEKGQLRNCFISWLIYLGLLSPQLVVTEKGHQILSFLEPGYPEFDQDPCYPHTDLL